MKEKFLPIGTVVTLKGGTVKLMIVGFCAISQEHEGQMFDYSALPYPVGEIIEGGRALFNHEQIDKIEHMGMESEEDLEYKEQIKMFLTLGRLEFEEKLREKQKEVNN
jgi:hypothetical protein